MLKRLLRAVARLLFSCTIDARGRLRPGFVRRTATLLRHDARLPRSIQAAVLRYVRYVYGRTSDTSALEMAASVGRLFQAHLRRGSLADLLRLYDQLYFLYWCSTRSIDSQRGFDENVVRPFSSFLEERVPARPVSRVRRDPVRLAYLAQHLHDERGNALLPVMEGGLSSLHDAFPGRYQIILYAWMEWSEPVLERMKARGIEVRRFDLREYRPAALAELRESLIRDELDVAITDMNSAVPHYLFETRIAPVQIFYQLGMPFWSIRELDYVFLAWNLDVGFTKSRVIGVPPAPIATDRTTPERVRSERARFPESARTVGFYGRLAKISAAYLETVRRILERSPGTIALLGGTGDAGAIVDFVRRHGLERRLFVANEFVDGHVWGRIIDVFLDTFPLTGGYSSRETLAKGKPVVHLVSDEMSNLNEMLDPELQCGDVVEYEERVLRLLEDGPARETAGRRAIEIARRNANPRRFAERFDAALQEALRS